MASYSLRKFDLDQALAMTARLGLTAIYLPALLRTLLEIDYQGYLAFEYESDANDPLPGLAESVGYVRGVLDEMAARTRGK